VQAYLDNQAGLRRLLRARMGADAQAEDVLQELYIRLRARPNESAIGHPAAYLYRMALNLARDYRRGWDRARVRDETWADENNTSLGGETVVETPSADRVLEARQRLMRIAATVAALPPQRKRVFTLHKLEGLSHAEVAQRLGISRSAVEKHMTAALKQLLDLEDRDI
jgi:RNA polymerase sigma-70 factor (ECF subfamily)